MPTTVDPATRGVDSLKDTLDPVSPPPEVREAGRTLRLTGTRIPLERVVYAFNNGRSPEQIVSSFPTLALADVYSLIGYYLRHRDAVAAYAAERRAEEERIRAKNEERFPSAGLRERLLARRAKRG
jgi:uncharacterized protein (DUF433 family)